MIYSGSPARNYNEILCKCLARWAAKASKIALYRIPHNSCFHSQAQREIVEGCDKKWRVERNGPACPRVEKNRENEAIKRLRVKA